MLQWKEMKVLFHKSTLDINFRRINFYVGSFLV